MSETIEPPRAAPRADAAAQRVARVYAEALLDEAQQRNAAAETLDELEGLVHDVAGADPLLASFFLGGAIGRENREAVLKAAFDGRVSDLLRNFLLVLNEHDRLDLLRPVLAAGRDLLEQRTGKVRVHVRSAVPLDDPHRERLVGELRQVTGREPVLEVRVDPDLLGGLVVQVGDWLYDVSVRARLEALRNQLIERSSHVSEIGEGG